MDPNYYYISLILPAIKFTPCNEAITRCEVGGEPISRGCSLTSPDPLARPSRYDVPDSAARRWRAGKKGGFPIRPPGPRFVAPWTSDVAARMEQCAIIHSERALASPHVFAVSIATGNGHCNSRSATGSCRCRSRPS